MHELSDPRDFGQWKLRDEQRQSKALEERSSVSQCLEEKDEVLICNFSLMVLVTCTEK